MVEFFSAKKVSLGILGGGRSIGKSCHAMRFGEVLVLIDAGMDPSIQFIPENAARFLPLLEGEDGHAGVREMMQGVRFVYIVVTHAHHDHAGAVIPVADYIENNFPSARLEILMTAPTKRFSTISWTESLRNMQKPAWAGAKPLFLSYDVARMQEKIKICEPGRAYALHDDINIMLIPAGHILGAASVAIHAWGMHFIHTGDIAFDDHHLVPGALYFPLPNLKVLISEGTYAGEGGTDRDAVEGECARGALEVLNRGGVALIPAFQIDRAQELMEMLSMAGIPESKIYLDGGARVMCAVYKEFLGKDWNSHFVRGRGHREKILGSNESCVVISSGGMLKGASLEWAKGILHREESAVFLNGWAEPCSPARQLLEIMQIKDDGREKELTVVNAEGEEERYSVRCELKFFHLSGHASGNQLEEYWREMSPEHLVLVHTEGEKTEKYLARERNNLGASCVHLPENGMFFDF